MPSETIEVRYSDPYLECDECGAVEHDLSLLARWHQGCAKAGVLRLRGTMTTPATPSAPTPAMSETEHAPICGVWRGVGYSCTCSVGDPICRCAPNYVCAWHNALAEIDRLRSSPGATPTAERGETMTDAHDAIFEGVREDAARSALAEAAREIPWVSGPVAHRIRVLRESHAEALATHSRDAAIGAALRAALAEVARGEQLEVLRSSIGDDRFLVHHSALTDDDGETDATRALASQLRAVTTGETT